MEVVRVTINIEYNGKMVTAGRDDNHFFLGNGSLDDYADAVWGMGWEHGKPPRRRSSNGYHPFFTNIPYDIFGARGVLLRNYRKIHPYLDKEQSRRAVTQLLRVVAMVIPKYNYTEQRKMTIEEYREMCVTVAGINVYIDNFAGDDDPCGLNAKLEEKLDSWEASILT